MEIANKEKQKKKKERKKPLTILKIDTSLGKKGNTNHRLKFGSIDT